MINVHTQTVQEANRHTAPLYYDIVAGLKHGRHFDARGAGPQTAFFVVLEAPLHVLGFQCENAHIDKKTTVAVLGETSQKVLTSKVYLHELLHRLHEGIGEPLRQLMER